MVAWSANIGVIVPHHHRGGAIRFFAGAVAGGHYARAGFQVASVLRGKQ